MVLSDAISIPVRVLLAPQTLPKPRPLPKMLFEGALSRGTPFERYFSCHLALQALFLLHPPPSFDLGHNVFRTRPRVRFGLGVGSGTAP